MDFQTPEGHNAMGWSHEIVCPSCGEPMWVEVTLTSIGTNNRGEETELGVKAYTGHTCPELPTPDEPEPDLPDLADNVAKLQVALKAAEENAYGYRPGIDPYARRTRSGRYVLLDALAALVNGQVALERRNGDRAELERMRDAIHKRVARDHGFTESPPTSAMDRAIRRPQ